MSFPFPQPPTYLGYPRPLAYLSYSWYPWYARVRIYGLSWSEEEWWGTNEFCSNIFVRSVSSKYLLETRIVGFQAACSAVAEVIARLSGCLLGGPTGRLAA